MKYGKEFQQILDDPSLPQEWKSSAIEYRRLKKLIKDVVAELSSMGLSPQVLQKLLVTENENSSGAAEGTHKLEEQKEPAAAPAEDDGDVLEFEFESDEASPPTLSTPSFAKQEHASHEPVEVRIDPIPAFEDSRAETGESSPAGPSSLPASHHRTFRLRLLSESETRKPEPIKPMGVMDMVSFRTEQRRRASEGNVGIGKKEEKEEGKRRGRKIVRRAVADDSGAVKAEYVLVGDAEKPTPQLRLHVSATSSPDRKSSRSPLSSSPSPSPSRSQSTEYSDGDYALTSESEDEPDISAPITTPLPKGTSSPQHTPRPFRSPHMVPKIDVIPPSPTLQKLRQAVSPIWALATGRNIQDGLKDLSLDLEDVSTPKGPKPDPFQTISTAPLANGNQSTSQAPASTALSSSPSSPSKERDFIIPLASDVAFFNLLTAALSTLSSFHTRQQEAFRDSVEGLCEMISSSIRPGSSASIQILPAPFTPSPLDAANTAPSSSGSSKALTRSKGRGKTASKKDLYAWREIFSLWIESEIFESSAERTRGERTVEQAEERLQKFANEVVKRGLGDRRTLKGKKVRGAWDEFLRLNVLLLDLKRFQMANINAARKILKKHDKRTALTASHGFPSFVRSTLSAQIDKDGNVSTWSFYNTSLPHVLLASLTDTLLPILPSLDDYACLICTSIAFKPIRLGCGHLFCVRCLVKMQRAGKDECPLCRSKVILLADKTSLDVTLMNFMKEWFPKEVKEKQKENEKEIAVEQTRDAGLDTRCVIM